MLALRLLGSFDVQGVDAGALPKKAQALLAYLALNHGRAVTRDQLAGLLWCLNTNEQARQNLRQCLAVTRAALGEAGRNAIEANAAGIRLSASEELTVDVLRFEALASSPAMAALAEANVLYGEGLLPGLEIASEPFNEWLGIERTRLATLHLDLLRRLAEAQAATGDHAAAIATARQLVQREPLREDAHRLMMRLYAAAGRRGEALRQFITCGKILQRELNVAPDNETAALAQQIRAGLEASCGRALTLAEDASPNKIDAPDPVPRANRSGRRFFHHLGRRPLAATATIAVSAVLLIGVAFAYLPPSAGALAVVGSHPPGGNSSKGAATTPAVARTGAPATAGAEKAVLSEADRRDCSGWRAKAGYSVDYIMLRTGKRQPGFAIEWHSNIDRDQVEPGDVAIFDAWHGHTAYVEQVERDGRGKPERLLVSSWNKPGNWLDVACVVTETFGRTTTFWVDADTVSRYWRPSL